MGFAVNYAMFMLHGRSLRGIVAGLGVGYATMIAPVYSAEISPAADRIANVLPGSLHQLRHPAGLRVQLRVRPASPLPRLARNARHRRGTVRASRAHGVRHA